MPQAEGTYRQGSKRPAYTQAADPVAVYSRGIRNWNRQYLVRLCWKRMPIPQFAIY